MQPALKEGCWALPAGNKTETHPETTCSQAPSLFRLSLVQPSRKNRVRLLRESSCIYPPRCAHLCLGCLRRLESCGRTRVVYRVLSPAAAPAGSGRGIVQPTTASHAALAPCSRKAQAEGARWAVPPALGFASWKTEWPAKRIGKKGTWRAVTPTLTLLLF